MAERSNIPKVRCAIYTRKSTEEGLDQEFNSLDAQREACAAYILSQRHEGWMLTSGVYDDGGFTGGNMERPGLKQLLADVQAGKVDVIVVYKVDRLTRSLADFAKIVDVLDARGASFVSITQSFNTTTSMGRLTLNVLLSFAQFEREVTGERIRDKIAASKRKGLWMGGPVPLGYEVKDRRLVVNEPDAETVRHIMQRYLELGSVRELIDELAREGWRTKVQARSSGPHRGGVSFRRGTLFHLLKNRIYLGEIVHKGVAHPGEHAPIIDRALWDRVQEKLSRGSISRAHTRNARHPSLLVGLLKDGLGRPMSPSHAVKGSKRYRYYVTHAEHLGPDQASAWRVPAHDVEAIVIDRLTALMLDRVQLHGMAASRGGDARAVNHAIKAGEQTAETLRRGATSERLELVQALIASVTLHEDRVEIAVDEAALLARMRIDAELTSYASPILLTSPAIRVRRGHELRLVIPRTDDRSAPSVTRDDKLVALIAEAQAARQLILSAPDHSLSRIAADVGRCRTRLTRLFTLSHLAPDIVTAVLEGRQPAALSHRQLLAIDLPLDWRMQRTALGFA